MRGPSRPPGTASFHHDRIWPRWWDTRSESYNLTGGEVTLDDEDKSKSTGVLYPAAELVVDSKGQLQMNLIGSPWKLNGILDWRGTPGVN